MRFVSTFKPSGNHLPREALWVQLIDVDVTLKVGGSQQVASGRIETQVVIAVG